MENVLREKGNKKRMTSPDRTLFFWSEKNVSVSVSGVWGDER